MVDSFCVMVDCVLHKHDMNTSVSPSMCYSNNIWLLTCSAGVILQCHNHLAAHPAVVRGWSGPGSPGGSGPGPHHSSGSDSTERTAGQPGDLPHPGPNCHCYWTDPVANLPGTQ